MTRDVEVAVAVMQQEILTSKEMIARMAANIEKLSDVSSDMVKIMAVHDERLEQIEKDNKDTDSKIEKMDREHQRQMDNMHDRMENMHAHLTNEIASTQRAIVDELAMLRTTLSNMTGPDSSLERRIKTLEKWRWMLLGAGMALGFAFGRAPLVNELLKAAFTGIISSI
jgi:hypothetical protein